jgi:DNA replication protein DnaC
MEKLAKKLPSATSSTASRRVTAAGSASAVPDALPCGCPEYNRHGATLPHECCKCHDAKRVSRRRIEVPPGTYGWIEYLPCVCTMKKPETDAEQYAEWKEFLRRSGITPFYEHCRLENFDPGVNGAALVACKNYAATFGALGHRPFLLLEGTQKGTGKTHQAVGTAIEVWSRKGVQAKFWEVPKLLVRYRATVHDGATETVEQIDAELQAAPLLILDDLGAEKGSDFVFEALYRVINHRYSYKAPTIVTTNVDLKDYDSRIASRLRDVNVGVAVLFRGSDQRQKERATA